MKGRMTGLPAQERIELASIPEPNSGCWIWLLGTNKKGYAHLRYNARMYRANRFSWETFKGPIPNGLHVLHRCDNRLCVNPDHFFLGTDLDNARDRDRKGRHINATLRGENHARAKLTTEQVLHIKKSTASHKELAAQYHVTPANIRHIRTGRNWTHLNKEPTL